jgi:hypothetical protein
MSRKTLPSPLPLISTLAMVALSAIALSQDNDHGKWVTDPNNQATTVFVFAPPPAGFDPLKASDTELHQYGFPPRPPQDVAKRYARWKKMVTAKRIMPEVTPTNIYYGPIANPQVVEARGSVLDI